jgi:hypothetical protein
MATQLFQEDVEICEQAEAHAADTTLARMALCDAIADHRDYQHNMIGLPWNSDCPFVTRFKHQYCGTWMGFTVLIPTFVQ